VFSIPKIIRIYFLHDRGLLKELARIAWEVLAYILAADGGFGESGMFYASHIDINSEELEPLFRYKVLSMLKRKGILLLIFYPKSSVFLFRMHKSE